MTPHKFEYMKFYDDLESISPPLSKINDPISRDFLLKISKIIRSEWEETKNKAGMSINIGKEDGLVRVMTLGSHDEKFSQKLIPLLHEIPKFLPRLLNLSVLIDNWKSIPPEFAELHELIEFSVGGNELSLIPPHLFDDMKNLKSIGFMSGKLSEFPPLTKSSFASIEDLFIFDCPYLRHIPDLGALVNLRGLEIKNSAIESLPDNLGDCYRLEEIKLTACWKLRTLPESISTLTSMREFRIYQCGLEELPKSLFKSPNPNQPNPPLIPMNIWFCPINKTLSAEMRENLPPSIYVDPYDVGPVYTDDGNINVNDTPYGNMNKMIRQDLEEWIEEAVDDEEEMKFLETTIAYQTYMEYLTQINFIPKWLEKRNKNREKAEKDEKPEITKIKIIEEFETHQENREKEKEKKEKEKIKWTKIQIDED